MGDAIDEALSAAGDAFRRTAQAQIDAVTAEMKDVLRVMYGKAPKEAIRTDLPMPRLQLRWARDWRHQYEMTCYYEMVFPLDKHDCRNDDRQGACVVELSRTSTTSGGRRFDADDPWHTTPFRDGSHIQWDNKAFGGAMPMYVIAPDGVARVLPPKSDDDN